MISEFVLVVDESSRVGKANVGLEVPLEVVDVIGGGGPLAVDRCEVKNEDMLWRKGWRSSFTCKVSGKLEHVRGHN